MVTDLIKGLNISLVQQYQGGLLDFVEVNETLTGEINTNLILLNSNCLSQWRGEPNISTALAPRSGRRSKL